MSGYFTLNAWMIFTEGGLKAQGTNSSRVPLTEGAAFPDAVSDLGVAVSARSPGATVAVSVGADSLPQPASAANTITITKPKLVNPRSIRRSCLFRYLLCAANRQGAAHLQIRQHAGADVVAQVQAEEPTGQCDQQHQ